jgi:hypothetical protein
MPDVSEFSVASTLLVGIDHTGRHRPSRSASTTLVGIASTLRSASTFQSASISLLIGIDQSSDWHRPFRSASTLLVGIDQPSGRHRPFGRHRQVLLVGIRPFGPVAANPPVDILPFTSFSLSRS